LTHGDFPASEAFSVFPVSVRQRSLSASSAVPEDSLFRTNRLVNSGNLALIRGAPSEVKVRNDRRQLISAAPAADKVGSCRRHPLC
jgi:hypothetical protein